jgi:hypothetical protein
MRRATLLAAALVFLGQARPPLDQRPAIAERPGLQQRPPVRSSLLTGLVARWSMDEPSDGSGPVIRWDSVGADDNLTDSGTVASTSGKFGLAAEFVPPIEYLYGTWPAAPPSGGFTVAFWEKFGIVSGSRPFSAGLDFRAGGTGLFDFYTGFGSGQFILGNSAGPAFCDTPGETGEWRLFIASYLPATKTARVYLDNTLIGETDPPLGSHPVFTFSSNWIHFGTEALLGTASDGAVDEAAIWARVLTAAERACLQDAAYPYGDVCLPY